MLAVSQEFRVMQLTDRDHDTYWEAKQQEVVPVSGTEQPRWAQDTPEHTAGEESSLTLNKSQ